MNLAGLTFIGGGTYLTGVTADSAKARFNGNYGIANTDPHGFARMDTNAAGTVLATQNTWYKLSGVTTNSGSQLFTHGSNRWTYAGGSPSLQASAIGRVAASTSSPSGDYEVAIFKNGIQAGPVGKGRAVSSALDTISCGANVALAPGDYLEVWARCRSAPNITFTWTDGALEVSGG